MSGTLNRIYTPPAAGSFDPYTAAITGGIPAFFTYREPAPPAAPEEIPSREVLADESSGPDSFGAGNVNMGGQMAGSIDLGPNPGNRDRGFGQASYGRTGQAIGSLAGLALGGPGLGLGLGALGTLADVRGLNADLAAMGLPQDVAFGPAMASSLTGGYFGTPAAEQFGNIAGFDIAAEAPLSAFGIPSEGQTQSTPPSGITEVEAMTQGLQSPTVGIGSYGFDTSPTAGGSGNFGAMSAQERGEQVGPPDSGAIASTPSNNDTGNQEGGTPGGTTDSAADSPGAGGGVGADGSVGSGGDAWKKGGLVKMAGGGLVPLAGGGKIAVGPGGGLDDLIPTSINGRRAAALSDGEFVIPADVVSMMGDGSSNAGARRLYDLVRQIRNEKTGTTKQAGPLPVGEILKRSVGR